MLTLIKIIKILTRFMCHILALEGFMFFSVIVVSVISQDNCLITSKTA